MSTISEAVRIIIGARDDASKVLERVSGAVGRVDGTLTGFGDTANKAGFDVGGLLEQFGGSEFTDFANQAQNAKGMLDEFNAANVKGAKGLGLMKVALVAAVAVAGFKFGQWLIGAKKLEEEFNNQLERSRDLIDQVSEARQRAADQGQFELSLFKDPEKQLAKLEDLKERAETELGGLESLKKAKQKLFDDLEKKLSIVGDGIPQAALDDFKALGNFVHDANAPFDRLVLHARKFNQLLSQIGVTSGNTNLKAFKEDLGATTEAFKQQEQIRDELLRQIARFKQANAARIEHDREAAEKTRTDEIAALIEKIKEENKVAGMTAEQLEIYKLKQLEATDADIAAAKAALDVRAARKQGEVDNSALDALRKQLMLLRDGEEAAVKLADVKAGLSKEAQAQAAKLRAEIVSQKQLNQAKIDGEKRFNSLRQEALKINKQHRTDGEKAREQYENLLRLQSEGLLTKRAFAAEKAKIAKEFAGEKDKAKQIGQLSAAESRFLTRGRDSQNLVKDQLTVQRQTKDLLQSANKFFADMLDRLGGIEEAAKDKAEVFDG